MLGKRIADERQRLGMSLTEFARRAGVHRNTQTRYESGERSPDAGYLDRLQKIEVNIPYVLFGRNMSPEEVLENALEEEYAELGRAFSEELGLSNNDLLLACSTVHRKMEAVPAKRPDDNNFEGFFHRYQAQLRNEFIKAANELLAKSPLVILKGYILVELIEKLEFVLEAKKLVLSPRNKAQAIMHLCQAVRASGGERVELKMIEAAIESST